MKERPILFSGPMVRALLEGRKTQTRRVVKQELRQLGDGDWYSFDHHGINYLVNARHTTVAAWAHLLQFCPYGKPSDRLWVREAWTTHAFLDKVPPRDLTTRSIHYVADGQIKTGKYRQAFHMPRWASRILLDVVGVRVERLQDISEEDAIAEGLIESGSGWKYSNESPWYACAIGAYQGLWESINGQGSWDENPWVWAIEFRREQA